MNDIRRKRRYRASSLTMKYLEEMRDLLTDRAQQIHDKVTVAGKGGDTLRIA